MDKLLLYLLKVAAISGVFYLLYLFLFSRDTFYFRNRFLLVIFLFLPMILPEIKIPVYRLNTTAEFNISDTGTQFSVSGTQPPIQRKTANNFNYNHLFHIIYFSLTFLLLIRALLSIFSTYKIIRKGNLISSRFPKIVLTNEELSPFSFYPYAVIPARFYNDGKYSAILNHELAHLRQGHTFDLLLSELFIAFQWFNPFAWLLKRSVILNHEYLADKISLSKNTGVKEYQYWLLNFQTELKSITLAHNFNSLTKNRIIMINKKPTHRNATLKNLLILPAIAFGIYAFSTPDYRNIGPAYVPSVNNTAVIYQKEIKGVVLKEDGKPFEGVTVSCTGKPGYAFILKTDKEGKFFIMDADPEGYIEFHFQGYKNQSFKVEFKKDMRIIMLKDPDYSNPEPANEPAESKRLVVVDREVTHDSPDKAVAKLNGDIVSMRNLPEKEAIEKYGEKGKNGVIEIYSRKRAKEFGIKVPLRRTSRADFPTFQGKPYSAFNDWVISKIKYPADASARGIQARIMANYTVDADGSITKVNVMGDVDPSLGNAVIQAIKSSPKWEPAKNPEANEPFDNMLSIKFILPDKVENDDAYVVVESMPVFPGGDIELLRFISENTQYPESEKDAKIQGKVIVRFVIDTDGKAIEPMILKGVDPLLDAEALRVVNLLNGFKPGTQGGRAVKVYYMVPVNFVLPATKQLFSESSQTEILKFFAMNTGYPEEARNISDTGSVYLVIKMDVGGTVKECKTVIQKRDITVPLLNEVVIVGHRTTTTNSLAAGKAKTGDHPLLSTECLRVARKLNELNLPEWKDKDVEFAIPLKFILK